MYKKVKIKIDAKDSNYIERLQFEYNASLNIIAFLMTKTDINEEYLQRYLDVAELRYTELEMAKAAVTTNYKPVDIPENYHYSFDFNTEEILYWVE